MFDVAILWSTLRIAIGHYGISDRIGIAVHGADAHVPDVMILFSDEITMISSSRRIQITTLVRARVVHTCCRRAGHANVQTRDRTAPQATSIGSHVGRAQHGHGLATAPLAL